MVKPRKKLSLSDKCPQFFKVFLPGRSSQRLRIPPAFLKHFDGVLPSKSIIRSLASRSWRVEVKEVDNNLYFEKGWHEFVKDNSLEFGDFLVFCYGGDSIFFVKVFGKNGCHKEDCIPTMEENQITETVKDEHLMLENNGKQPKTNRTLHRRGLMAVQETDKSLKPPGKFLSSFPSFQVVMKKAYVDKSFMQIPPAFLKHFDGVLPSKSIIRSHASRSWPVEMREVDNNLYFEKGWHEFVEDSSLEFGDFLVFCYGGDSIFFVQAYGKNGCHKEVCIPTRKKSIAFVQKNQKKEPMKEEQLMVEDNGKQQKTSRTSRGRGLLTVQENDKALKPPGKFVSSYPSFEVVIMSAYLENRYMHVPTRFVKSYMKQGRRDVILRVSAKSWDVKFISYMNSHKFSKGWGEFCKDNTLQVGDSCVFELVEREDFVLKVSVFRYLN
ncbi:putative B3 domain-containing protein At5g66980 [Cornus florida]|uniref:putative B3 domain-containing protein At5g66980 n=1 Tax=Cornus florida TaxID=4283 RepID=UPI00289D6287|nr:putative B3 domain-containing protein At5g66980 [Cornus florida]